MTPSGPTRRSRPTPSPPSPKPRARASPVPRAGSWQLPQAMLRLPERRGSKKSRRPSSTRSGSGAPPSRKSASVSGAGNAGTGAIVGSAAGAVVADVGTSATVPPRASRVQAAVRRIGCCRNGESRAVMVVSRAPWWRDGYRNVHTSRPRGTCRDSGVTASRSVVIRRDERRLKGEGRQRSASLAAAVALWRASAPAAIGRQRDAIAAMCR